MFELRPAAVLAKLCGPAMAAAFLEGAGGSAKGLTAAQRATELDRIAVELDKLELAEEQAIREAEAAGNFVERRADARPEIVLAGG